MSLSYIHNKDSLYVYIQWWYAHEDVWGIGDHTNVHVLRLDDSMKSGRKAKKTTFCTDNLFPWSINFKKDRAIFLKYPNNSHERRVELTFEETLSPRDGSEVERLDVSEFVRQKAAVPHLNLRKEKCRILKIKARQEEEEEPWGSGAVPLHFGRGTFVEQRKVSHGRRHQSSSGWGDGQTLHGRIFQAEGTRANR